MKTIGDITWNIFLITLGSVICAVAVNSILVPKQFLAGGFTGLAMLIHYAFPVMPVGASYFALNIPVFIFGWMFVGRRFFIYSIAGMLIFSLVVLIPFPEITIEDRLLNSLTAGIITGIGAGILLRSLGSAGGMDILGIIIL
ncbi:MAG: YitT family protein, partial [Deltaproteobacteria bacterium]